MTSNKVTCGCEEATGNQMSCCGSSKGQSACCGAEERTSRRLLIEFLYIDLTTCDRCLDTDAILGEACADVALILRSAGYILDVRKILVETEAQAQQLKFASSPTIRINGHDIQLDFRESSCACCGDIAGVETDCRVWVWQGQEYTTPPKAMLIDAILRYIYGGVAKTKVASQVDGYQVPDNLKRFFAANSIRK
ncbi:DUF2703 domain-containing protein [Sporomusa sphaeroides]|uniref:DUF2703 domain-containing protein n=1 Tax=Sporomusa sphaeroides TaxID=47679 RepID=UPI002C8A9B11|nr:DUF2703 domain-containing protein [Sporomusa sphaeroides]HML32014.1 DUF2703 domain-containing protein [Sporomusa sphaeroides]